MWFFRRFWRVFSFWCKNKNAVFFFADMFCLKKISKKWIYMSVRANLLSMCNGISSFQSDNWFFERFWTGFPFRCKNKKAPFFLCWYDQSRKFVQQVENLRIFRPIFIKKNHNNEKKHARLGFENLYKKVCFRLEIIALFFSINSF